MKRIFGVLLAGAVMFGVSGCSDDQYQSADYARICIDEKTQQRVEGDRCGNNDSIASSGFLWWYILYGRTIPAYGQPVVGGYSTVKKSAVIEHDESYAPKGGKNYTKTPTRTYSNGSGKKLGTTSGGTGYKAPAPPAPKVNNPPPKVNAPKPQVPAVRPPAPAPRPVAPAPRPPAPVKIK